jgi:hypothetical protein
MWQRLHADAGGIKPPLQEQATLIFMSFRCAGKTGKVV